MPRPSTSPVKNDNQSCHIARIEDTGKVMEKRKTTLALEMRLKMRNDVIRDTSRRAEVQTERG